VTPFTIPIDARAELRAWVKAGNNKKRKVDGLFTTEDARSKLARFYLTLEETQH